MRQEDSAFRVAADVYGFLVYLLTGETGHGKIPLLNQQRSAATDVEQRESSVMPVYGKAA